jgi:MFS family permease
LNCALIYGSFFTFTGNGNDMLHTLFGISTTEAGSLLTSIFICAAVITPLFGMLIDKYGRIGYVMLVSLFLFLSSLIIILVVPSYTSKGFLILPLVLIGFFYSTYAAVFWPCIPLVIENKNHVGTAYGVVNSV